MSSIRLATDRRRSHFARCEQALGCLMRRQTIVYGALRGRRCQHVDPMSVRPKNDAQVGSCRVSRSCRARRRILRSHQCPTTNEPLGDSVSENELRRESKTHSFLSWLENQLSYICDQRIVSCRMKASPPGKCQGSFSLDSILRHLIDPGSPLEVTLVFVELTPRASLKGGQL